MDTSTLIIIGAVVLALVVVAMVWWSRSRATSDVDTTVSERLTRPGSVLGAAVRRALGSGLDETTWDSLEEALLAGDVGVAAATDIVESVRGSRPASVDEARESLVSALREEMAGKDRGLHLDGAPSVVLVVGVNGSGKTTTIAKLARRLLDEGRTVTLGAADTFRAAAVEQLETWGRRLDVKVVRGQEGGDPASVAHDAISSARARGVDVVVIDTAGRLHAKKNLMAELQKIHRVAGGDEVDEVLLVLDATGGQNGLAQVEVFSEAVPTTGIVLTKLDGTAKGGIVIAVERTLGVPVKLVGMGEGLGDLDVFDPDSFVDSLLT
ncbi:MAG: signal recognition particle-docking protein FtsY [Acidimicrobiia bacterium]|jgi:fused signal recognition particle receptor